MFCPKCGSQLPEHAAFCGTCGASLNAVPAPNPIQEPPVAAPIQTPAQPVPQPVPQQIPVVTAPVAVAAPAETLKKKKTGLIVGIIAGVVVLLVGTFAVLWLTGIISFGEEKQNGKQEETQQTKPADDAEEPESADESINPEDMSDGIDPNEMIGQEDQPIGDTMEDTSVDTEYPEGDVIEAPSVDEPT